MKLYTFTSDTDYGLNTWLFATRSEAEAAMERAVRPRFEDAYPAEAWPGPQEAAYRLSELVGWIDSFRLDEHEIALSATA